MSHPIDDVTELLRQALSTQSTPYRTEKELQDILERVIFGLWPRAMREPILTPHDIPDFTVPCSMLIPRPPTLPSVFALEVKTRCPRLEILRQIKRYNEIPIVAGTVLICIKPVPEFPESLSGKPVRQLNLYRNVM